MRAELFRLHRLVATLFALVALFSCNRGGSAKTSDRAARP